MTDPGLLANAVERLRAIPELWAAELVRDLAARPAVARELHRRRVWTEAAEVFDALLAAGSTTRAAAQATRRRLLSRGLDAPHWNTLRQRLLRQRLEARPGGNAPPSGAHTDGHATIPSTP